MVTVEISAAFVGPLLMRGEALIRGRRLFEAQRLLKELRYGFR